MKEDGTWEIDASMGAINALRENTRHIGLEVLKKAEELAIERSKIDGYEPAIKRRDVELAIKLAGDRS